MLETNVLFETSGTVREKGVNVKVPRTRRLSGFKDGGQAGRRRHEVTIAAEGGSRAKTGRAK